MTTDWTLYDMINWRQYFQKYEKKVISQYDNFKKSYNFKPITTLNGSNQNAKQPKQSNGQVPESSAKTLKDYKSAHIATPTTNERPGPQNQRQNLDPQSAETATW